jgi:creatinine amidohydrolase/Fe(II)-dependent formamide hydrolase-like protein
MDAPKQQASLLNLSRLVWIEVEKEIQRVPFLIVPLGGCEPFGRLGSFGIASLISRTLANALSEKMHVLCAPVLNYGCSTPFQSFGGTAGLKPRTLVNAFCETCRMWFFQGFRNIVVVNAITENSEALGLAVKRLKASHPDNTVVLFSLQQDERIRAFIAKHQAGRELGRTEYGMLSMASWIDPAMVRPAEKEPAAAIKPDAARYKQWHKRGADPEQFRKLFPDGSSSDIARGFNADFGRQLFGYILTMLEETVAALIPPTAMNRKSHASS